MQCSTLLHSLTSIFARQCLGWTNYWTAALVPGWLSCFLAIFLERPARRTALATYVSTVVSGLAGTVMRYRYPRRIKLKISLFMNNSIIRYHRYLTLNNNFVKISDLQ